MTWMLWFCALGCGLIAGLYFAFSTFIMTAFAQLPPGQGAAAMNTINVVIQRSLFMPLFLGTTLGSVVLTGLSLWRWGEPGMAYVLAGGLVYVPGMFLCTMFFNVPLNNELEATPTDAVWARYLASWTPYNHVRTITSTVASGLYIAALLAR
jgi:uncharacterized membrane protein